MTKKISLPVIFIFIFVSAELFSVPKAKLKELDAEINIASVAFEEGEYLKISDKDGNLLAYYQRLKSENTNVRMAKIYNPDKELLYTLIPAKSSRQGTVIIKDSKDEKINLGFNVETGMGVVFMTFGEFDKAPFNLGMSVFNAFGEMNMEIYLDKDKSLILYYSPVTTKKEVEKKKVLLKSDFFNEDKMKAVMLSISLLILDELHSEMLKSFYM